MFTDHVTNTVHAVFAYPTQPHPSVVFINLHSNACDVLVCVYVCVCMCHCREEIYYGEACDVVTANQSIRFDEFEHDVTSVRRTAMYECPLYQSTE